MKIKKIAQDVFERDLPVEESFGIKDLKLYGYIIDTELTVIGEIICEELIENAEFSCSIYDDEGDIVDVFTNCCYGDAVVSSNIPVGAFFNGFPIAFREYIKKDLVIGKIRVVPE